MEPEEYFEVTGPLIKVVLLTWLLNLGVKPEWLGIKVKRVEQENGDGR